MKNTISWNACFKSSASQHTHISYWHISTWTREFLRCLSQFRCFFSIISVLFLSLQFSVSWREKTSSVNLWHRFDVPPLNIINLIQVFKVIIVCVKLVWWHTMVLSFPEFQQQQKMMEQNKTHKRTLARTLQPYNNNNISKRDKQTNKILLQSIYRNSSTYIVISLWCL